LGVGGDISQYIDKPETRGWLPYALTAAGAIPFLGALAKMAGPLPKGIMKSQAGAIAYHGSPHKFDSFDASKIGTGEGAQAYGHGLYLAENPSVASQYAQANRGRGAASDGLIDALPKQTQVEVYKAMQTPDGWLRDSRINEIVSRYPEAGPVFSAKQANLYKTDIPDEWLPKMLDWDKPLGQQSQSIKDLAKQWNGGKMPRESMSGDELLRFIQSQLKGIGRGHERAEDALKRAGIPGIRYLDGGSRAGGQGTYNYVVFPGMEKQVKILSRE
jgi:hypothetical protein